MNISKYVQAAILAAFAFMLAALPAAAQVVTRLPVYVDNGAGITDLGNGPIELRVLQGSASIFTSQSSGTGSTSGSSTALTLTGTPTTPPCVGCALSGTGITAGTTVISFNGTTTVGMSAAMTVASGTAVAWGAACPTTITAPAIAATASLADLPLYSYSRICAGAQFSAGAMILPFAIGAH